MAVPNMIVTLAMNATKYASGLKKAAGQTNTFGSMATKAFNLAKGAMLGLTLAAIRFIPELANMGAESRKADIQLRFMLENMQGVGAATNATVKRMDAYAQKVMLATAVDDEQIKAVQKKLLMFKAVRKSADEMGGSFDRATSAAIDLAAGGFGEMETNAVRLGRMLQAPTNSLTALNKAGVVFTETEKKKIIALAESGKLLEAQDLILQKVEGRVKGLAEESATPWEKMMVALGQIGDSIGDALLDPLDDMNNKIRVWLASPQSKKDIQDITDAFVALGEGAKFTLDIILQIKKGLDDVTAFNMGWVGALREGRDAIIGRKPSRDQPFGGTSGQDRISNKSAPIINFNAPIDSVSAGREVARLLNDYNRSNGGRR